MRYLLIVALSFALVAPGTVAAKCSIDWWKRERGAPITKVYGKIKPGSGSRVFVEIWYRGELVAESWSYANPRGVFEVHLLTQHRPRKRASTRITCR